MVYVKFSSFTLYSKELGSDFWFLSKSGKITVFILMLSAKSYKNEVMTSVNFGYICSKPIQCLLSLLK